ncbi:hypothetical protein EDD21DRAFT_449382 [Dissophora ornata]|nr:hypothetical protein EDD21DRAFT_449382 [Dissophora ornata]
MLYNPSSQPSIGSKKPFNNYQPNMSMMGQQPQGPMGSQPSLSVGGPGGPGGGGGGGGGGGHGMYDIERRPPKSAELFDPNGPSSSNNGPGGQGDHPGAFRNQGFHDGVSTGGAQEGHMMMMMGGERGHQQSQGQNFYPASHQGGPGFNSNYQAQMQPQPHLAPPHLQQQHHNQQQQSHLTHVPVGMNRSYSSSSSTSYGSGNASSNAGPHQGKKNNLLYDYSVLATPYDGVAKATSPEAERSPSLSHILEIHAFHAQDDIFEDLMLPNGSKLRRLKPSARDPVGQCLVVFKNANLATEALAAFQEGKETWMGPEAKLKFESSLPTETETEDETVESEDELNSARLQRRFNVKLWTPVLVNSTTPTPAVAGGAGSAGINAAVAAAAAGVGVGGNDSPVRDAATTATTASSVHLGNEEEDEAVKVEREE